MIQTAEQIIESIRALPSDERGRLLKAVELENDKQTWQNGTKDEVAEQSTRFRKAQQWIEDHKVEYDGQYVLLDGEQLLGNGTNPQSLYAYARSIGIKSPYVTRIKAVELPFGGW